MIEIPLTKDKVALIDNEDFDLVNQYTWYAILIPLKSRNIFYAHTTINGKTTYMHRILLDAKKGQEVDHINHDGLDNRRRNLRLGSHRKNQVNRKKEHSSIYPGVTRVQRIKPWRAATQFKGKHTTFGHFKSEIEAFEAYQKGVFELTGEWIEV